MDLEWKKLYSMVFLFFFFLILYSSTTIIKIILGKAEKDYLGRSWISPPTDIDVDLFGDPTDHSCFLPKRHIHTWFKLFSIFFVCYIFLVINK